MRPKSIKISDARNIRKDHAGGGRKISTIDLNGEHIIDDCINLLVSLKEKLSELKFHVETHPFVSEAEEITFFKYRKPLCWDG